MIRRFIKLRVWTFQPLIVSTEGLIVRITLGMYDVRQFIGHWLIPLDTWITLRQKCIIDNMHINHLCKAASLQAYLVIIFFSSCLSAVNLMLYKKRFNPLIKSNRIRLCPSLSKDIFNCWTNMVLLYIVDYHKSGDG